MSRQRTDDGEEGFRRFEEFLEEWSRRDFMKRSGAAAAFTAFMAGGPAALLAACGSGQQGQPAASPVKGGKLIEGAISDVSTFNTINAGDTQSIQVFNLIFDSLLTYRANGDLTGRLATDVPKPSSDNLTYTFKLRPNVKWSDGQPLTADDIVYTYRLMHDDAAFPDVISRYRDDLKTNIANVTAPDPQTVVFKMKKIFASFLDDHCSYRILPKHVLGNITGKAFNTADFFSAPTVASGPFKFVKWDKGQQVVLGRNDTHWGGAPFLDQYIAKFVSDAVVLAQQLKTGEIDVGNPDPSQWDNLATAANINRVKFVDVAFTYYGYNLDPAKKGGKLFGDKNVRKALFMALDRDKMAEAVYFKQAVPADTVQFLNSWAHNPNVKFKYPYDKKKAEEMLDAAGWVKGPDGIRAKGDQKLKFEMNTNAGNKVRENLLVVMQAQWKDIGVDATPRNITFPALVTQLRSQRTFDVFLLGIASGSTDPDQRNLWTTSGIGATGLNGMDYMNPEVDRLMDDALNTTDRNKRKDDYFKIQDILADELPAPILFYPNRLYGINKRVQNFNVGPYNTYNARPWMKDVYVTDGK